MNKMAGVFMFVYFCQKQFRMTLIKSISGIRGIIGTGLTPPEIIRYSLAYGAFQKVRTGRKRIKIVIGRDARVSGKMMFNLVSGALLGSGADVIDLGLAATPTVEIAVPGIGADGGIIITASHNPGQWNALKLLNEKGEFLSAEEGQMILDLAENNDFEYVETGSLGRYSRDYTWLEQHIRKILELPLVNTSAIRNARLKVVFDAVNSVGGIALPMLLDALEVSQVIKLNAKPDGKFTHNPEPLPENLSELSQAVVKNKADVGFAVDPDVDRLAIVMENGGFFGEEYTLVSVADYVLKEKPGNSVSNLSSSRALKDITEKYDGIYYTSAVGEVNVVAMMKAKQAVIGGEGNGGVIFPELHFGRDALVGTALFLSHLALSGMSCAALRKTYPDYHISKNKVTIKTGVDLIELFDHIKSKYQSYPLNETDGLRIDFENGWVHLRQSNTEPIMRIYAESTSMEEAEKFAKALIGDISAWTC